LVAEGDVVGGVGEEGEGLADGFAQEQWVVHVVVVGVEAVAAGPLGGDGEGVGSGFAPAGEEDFGQ
jgi:hypothetical protein